MNLIKLSTQLYPYTISELRRDYPNVSFPSNLTGLDLTGFDCAEVITEPTPVYDSDTQMINTLPPVLIEGQWTIQWEVRDLTPEELKSRMPIGWGGFNAYMLTDTMFKSYRDAVRAIDGDLTPALFNAYTLVASNGVDAFSLVWGAWVQASGITIEDREAIALAAESNNLPTNFISVIRG